MFNYTKNLAQSSLASNYTAGATTITVQPGDGALFDVAPFVVAVGSPPAFFLKVTAVATDVFTVDTSGFDGSSVSNQSSGTAVTEVITAGVLADLLANAGNSITRGTYASLPGSGNNAGDMYLCTDSPYEFIWTGSIWQARFRGIEVTPPGPSSAWTNVNLGTSVTTDEGGMIGLQLEDTSGLNWRMWSKSTPSTPYHVVFFQKPMQFDVNVQTSGVYFYDGTKLMGIEFLSSSSIGDFIRVEKINSVTSDNSTAAQTQANLWSAPHGGIWYRIGNNGTNLTFDFALEPGLWINLFTEAVGTFITPTGYGFGGLCVTNGAAPLLAVALLSAQITS